MTTKQTEKAAIIAALRQWIEQRPGLEPANYFSGGSMEQWRQDRRNYDSERRAIYRDLQDARTLLRAVEWRESVTADMLVAAFRDAYSGRLSLRLYFTGGEPCAELTYCTGQYWPTEYRKAACAVLASALWAYFRDGGGASMSPGVSAGDSIRNAARREFGARMAARWFDWTPQRARRAA